MDRCQMLANICAGGVDRRNIRDISAPAVVDSRKVHISQAFGFVTRLSNCLDFEGAHLDRPLGGHKFLQVDLFWLVIRRRVDSNRLLLSSTQVLDTL